MATFPSSSYHLPTTEEQHKAEEENFRELVIFVSRSDSRFPTDDLSSPASFSYYFRHGAQDMAKTRYNVLEALRNCGDLQLMFRKPGVNVVNLGGGPGTDVVGLTSALFELGIHSDPENGPLNIAIVDSFMEAWSPFLDVLERFVLERDFGNATKYFRQNKVNLRLIPAKQPLFDDMEHPVCRVIEEADIVLMTRVLGRCQNRLVLDMSGSEPYNSTPAERKKLSKIIQQVRENMQDGAIALIAGTELDESDWTGFEFLYLLKWYKERKCSLPAPFRYKRQRLESTSSEIYVFRRNLAHKAQITQEPELAEAQEL